MKRFVLGLVASTVMSVGMPASGWAATVKIDFQPPQIATQPICTARRLDSAIVEEWHKWDRKALPARDPDSIMRDARRLRDMDASENFDIVERIIALIPTIDPKQKPDDSAVERISLYLAAGKLKELRGLGLVQRLVDAQATASPRIKNILADLYETGAMLGRDENKAIELRVAAAYGGNADAILALVKLNLEGRKIQGWDVEPDLGVIMAFGALVGKLDPAICDRVGRIAREFERGDIVTKDSALSEQWYRFAADLGDGLAAWKVATMHLESEEIVKNNDTLLRYLELASGQGVAAAKVELARMFEIGSLLPLDPGKATALYQEASAAGSRAALVRLALMMEHRRGTPADREQYRSVLNRLEALPNPPGWVYARLASSVLEEKGRWAGQDEAIALVRKGADLQDPDSEMLLAQLLLSQKSDRQTFNVATELMTNLVERTGKNEPLAELYGAYACRAPDGMNKRLATFWHAADERTGNESLVMRPEEIRGLVEKANPQLLAILQTQALYGRPKSVAYYLSYLEQSNASAEELAFWRQRAEATPVRAAMTRLDYQVASDAQMAEIIDRFAALAEELPEMGIDIGKVVLEHFPTDKARVAMAQKYLTKAAAAGYGKALWMLAEFARSEPDIGPRLYDTYSSVIDARGDSSALLFGARHSSDPETRARMLQRAVSIMPCDFENAMEVLDGYASLGSDERVSQWLDIVEELASGNGWRMVAAADRRLALQGNSQMPRAIDIYTASLELGEVSAPSRLLKLYGDAKADTYDPGKAVVMFTRLVQNAGVGELENLLQRISKAPPVIRDTVMAQISASDLYLGFAEKGEPVGMREYARLVRDGKTKSDPATATVWFEKAAKAGDAEAMVDLAKAYAFGVGVKPSITKATTWLKTASDKGNTEALQLLATMNLQGATQ